MNRRTHILALGACLGCFGSAGAAKGRPAVGAGSTQQARPLEWITPAVEGPGLTFRTFWSKAAGTEVSFHIYTPPAYNAEPARRLPVVYWLHGSGGGLAGIPRLAALVDKAIATGAAPPFLMVFVNGLRMGMYVDWANGNAPLETVIVHELRPYIDANWRTIANRDGRLLDGFSMGGYGAARFGFLYPALFRNVSIMGAGPMQETLERTPRASKVQTEDLLRDVYGGGQDGFRAASPRRYAEQNAAVIARTSRVRLVIGEQDETLQNNRDFHAHLLRIGIPHDWIVLPGVGHDPLATLAALGDRHWAFYREAFADAGVSP